MFLDCQDLTEWQDDIITGVSRGSYGQASDRASVVTGWVGWQIKVCLITDNIITSTIMPVKTWQVGRPSWRRMMMIAPRRRTKDDANLILV